MVRNRSAFLDGLKARLEGDRAEREEPVVGGEPQPRAAPTAAAGEARASGGGSHATARPRSVPGLDSRSAAVPDANAASAMPDLPTPRTWSASGMPERMRQAIASVRRISIEEAAELDDPEFEPPALREAPGRFVPADPPAPPAPVDPPERAAPLDPPAPSLLEIREPVPPEAAARSSAAARGFARPPFLHTRAPPLHTRAPPSGVPEPPLLDAPEPSPAPEPSDPPAALDGPGRRPYWRPGEAEPGPGRGIRIAALVMAAAVVVLVGSGLGALLAGWQLELPSLLTGIAAAPEPVAESEAPPPGAGAPEAPPPIAEVTRVEPAPMPPAAAVGPAPRAAAATAGLPLPPPPKPAPSSRLAAESSATTDDAVENALDALLRETNGSGGPLEPLDGEEASLAPTRVFVHYAANAAGEQATAMHLARLLEAKGFAVEAREVDFPIDLDSIRYFYAADRDDAEALSASLDGQVPGGAPPRVLDFTAYEPKPGPGYLELWIGP